MAAVDALSLPRSAGPRDAWRWAAGGAFALAVHALALAYLNRAPAPVGFETQIPVEMELTPPPAGEARMQEPGAVPSEAAETAQDVPDPEMLDEITDEEIPPPPPDSEVVAAEPPPPEEVETLPEVAAIDQQFDKVETPPDVQAAVTLPPETVVAREVPVETPKPPPPVVRREEPKPKPEPKPVRREEPKPVAKKEPTPQELERRREAAERREEARKAAADARAKAKAAQSARAGGSAGASANAGASRAAAAGYRQRVQAAVAAQKRSSLNLVGRATVSFTVSRSGAVSGVSASGPGPVAAEAAAMVRRAGIPPMPSDMTVSSMRYTVPISFTSRR